MANFADPIFNFFDTIFTSALCIWFASYVVLFRLYLFQAITAARRILSRLGQLSDVEV